MRGFICGVGIIVLLTVAFLLSADIGRMFEDMRIVAQCSTTQTFTMGKDHVVTYECKQVKP